jgi:hypothetical protein
MIKFLWLYLILVADAVLKIFIAIVSFVLSLGEHMSQTKTIYRESFASLCICLIGTFLPEYVLFSSSWRVADDFDAK